MAGFLPFSIFCGSRCDVNLIAPLRHQFEVPDGVAEIATELWQPAPAEYKEYNHERD
jgi:hypothetical protein